MNDWCFACVFGVNGWFGFRMFFFWNVYGVNEGFLLIGSIVYDLVEVPNVI